MRVLRPPSGPFEMNRASPQARGLLMWAPSLPGARAHAGLAVDRVRHLAATMNGAMSWVPNPVAGAAWVFSGSGTYLRFASVLASGSNMAIAAWVRCTSAAAAQYVVTKSNGASAGAIVLSLGGTPYSVIDGMAFYAGGGLSGWKHSGINSYDIRNDGLTHLVVGTYDKQYLRYYVDGILRASAAETTALPAAAVPIDVGVYANDSAYYTGQVGGVRIYDRCPSADDVWQMWDPMTRWELYEVQRRVWALSPGGAPPAGRRRSWATIIGG